MFAPCAGNVEHDPLELQLALLPLEQHHDLPGEEGIDWGPHAEYWTQFWNGYCYVAAGPQPEEECDIGVWDIIDHLAVFTGSVLIGYTGTNALLTLAGYPTIFNDFNMADGAVFVQPVQVPDIPAEPVDIIINNAPVVPDIPMPLDSGIEHSQILELVRDNNSDAAASAMGSDIVNDSVELTSQLMNQVMTVAYNGEEATHTAVEEAVQYLVEAGVVELTVDLVWGCGFITAILLLYRLGHMFKDDVKKILDHFFGWDPNEQWADRCMGHDHTVPYGEEMAAEQHSGWSVPSLDRHIADDEDEEEIGEVVPLVSLLQMGHRVGVDAWGRRRFDLEIAELPAPHSMGHICPVPLWLSNNRDEEIHGEVEPPECVGYEQDALENANVDADAEPEFVVRRETTIMENLSAMINYGTLGYLGNPSRVHVLSAAWDRIMGLNDIMFKRKIADEVLSQGAGWLSYRNSTSANELCAAHRAQETMNQNDYPFNVSRQWLSEIAKMITTPTSEDVAMAQVRQAEVNSLMGVPQPGS